MPAHPRLTLVAAVARNGAIGRDNALLVHLPGDLPRFKAMTWGHAVLMGRKTWDSIGRPLPGRRNLVMTRNTAWSAPGAEPVPDLASALGRTADAPDLFVIGGADIFAATLPLADVLELTEIDAELEGDTYFPSWDRSAYALGPAVDRIAPDGLRYRYVRYERLRAATPNR